jgi:hypothetical protein
MQMWFMAYLNNYQLAEHYLNFFVCLVYTNCNQFCFHVINLDSPEDALTENTTSDNDYIDFHLRQSLLHPGICLHLGRPWQSWQSWH